MRKIINISRFLLVACCLLTHASAAMADTDLAAYGNVIYVAPATVDPLEGTEVTLSICMNNTAAIRGFQFDLYLPAGMTVVKTSKGKIAASLSADRLPEDDEHTLTVAEQTDGAIRFLCGSQYDETFTGTSGEIATLKVNIEGMADGEYPITLKGVKLSESDISKFYEVPEVVTTLTVSSTPTGISDAARLNNKEQITNNERDTINNQWFTLDGRRVARSMFNVQRSMLKKGVYIKNGMKVVIK